MKTIELLDVCLPDYFTGYHRPVIAVPVHNGMTFDELSKEIENELNYSWDYLCNQNNGFSKTEVLIIDDYVRRLKEDQVYKDSGLFIGTDELEEDENEEYIESVYAYFSLCRLNRKYGITFLDR